MHRRPALIGAAVAVSLMGWLAPVAANAPGTDVLIVADQDQQLHRIHGNGSGSESVGLADGEMTIGYSPEQASALVLAGDWSTLDLVDVKTGTRTTLVPELDASSLSASFDPTGDRVLLITEAAGESEVRLLAADGSSETALLPGEWPGNSYFAMGWAPDGQSVVVSGWAGSPAKATAWQVELDGSGRVERPAMYSLSPQPGGTVAVGVETDGSGARLVRYDESLTQTDVLQQLPTTELWAPVWSADGSRVAAQTAPGEMTVYTSQGTVLDRLGDDEWEGSWVTYGAPALSPDGTVLMVHGDASASGHWSSDGIYAFDVQNGRSCQVTDIYNHLAVTDTSFSPDGSYALLSNGSVAFRWPVAAGAKPVPAGMDGLSLVGWVTPPGVPAATTPCAPQRDVRAKSLVVFAKKTGGAMRFRAERGGYEPCRVGQTVRVHRKARGHWRLVRTLTTDSRGFATITVSTKGTYRFSIAKHVSEPFLCPEAKTLVQW